MSSACRKEEIVNQHVIPEERPGAVILEIQGLFSRLVPLVCVLCYLLDANCSLFLAVVVGQSRLLISYQSADIHCGNCLLEAWYFLWLTDLLRFRWRQHRVAETRTSSLWNRDQATGMARLVTASQLRWLMLHPVRMGFRSQGRAVTSPVLPELILHLERSDLSLHLLPAVWGGWASVGREVQLE